ncbi:MAG: enolase C-terminal domain-like protein [Desulfitobacteriaceae bacterium]
MDFDESAVIDSIRLVEVSIPLAVPFQISGGICRFRHSLIIELTADGMTGYGEAAPFDQPFYSSETFSSARALVIDSLLPRLIGSRIESIEQLNRILTDGVRGNPFARAGVETAYWDLIARKNHLTLQELLYRYLRRMGLAEKDLAPRTEVESGVSVGIPEDGNYDTLRRWVAGYAEEGYRRIKIKVKPGWDLEAVRVSREVLGSKFPFWVDANSSFELEEHLSLFQAMDAYGCLFYEQPLHHDDILDHAQLARKVQTPICLDESLKSYRVGKQVIEQQASRIWNIKVQRVGGLWEAIRLYVLAVRNGVSLWAGTMPETGVGAMAILALGSFKHFHYPSDVEASHRWYGPGHDLIEIAVTPDGRIELAEAEGIGMINHDNYRRYGKLLEELCQ